MVPTASVDPASVSSRMCIWEQHTSGNNMLLTAAETAQGYAYIKHTHLDGRQL